MGFPDSAEYWHDVKGYFQNKRDPFVHIEGHNCGHYHVIETSKLYKVDCHACRKHIESNAELVSLMHRQQKKDEQKRLKKIKEKWLKRYPNNPVCPTCGFIMLERKNTHTGISFYGCCQYPKCKTTLSKN